MGRACILPETGEKMITAVDCTIVRFPEQQMLPEFFVYYSQTREYLDAVADRCTGTTRSRISRANLGAIPVPVPPLDDQKRIVAVLSEVFEDLARAADLADANRCGSEDLLEAFASRVFAKVSESKTSRTLTVAELAASSKGAIRTGPFGSQLLHGEFVESGVAVLGIDNAVSNHFAWGKRRCITLEKYQQLKRYTVHPGDVLITIMGTCGRCAVVPDDIPLAINSKHLCCISLNREACDPHYLQLYFLYSPKALRYLSEQTLGSIMDGLNMGIIKELPVDCPSMEEQRNIVLSVSRMRDDAALAAKQYEAELSSLDDLRQSLLHRAFAGDLT